MPETSAEPGSVPPAAESSARPEISKDEMAALLKKMLQVEQSSACADITVLADDGNSTKTLGSGILCAGHARD